MWVGMWVQMAPKQIINFLNAIDINRKGPGMYLDGAGLYLQVKDTGRSWIYRFKSPTRGKSREMGLGPTHTIGLAKARELRNQSAGLVASGIDPIDERNKERISAKAKTAVTFEKAVEGYIAANRHTWTNVKSEAQWRSSLKEYAYPLIGDEPVGNVNEEHILKILEPIWHDKRETATRVRSRLERILERETVLKHRNGDNPARLTFVKTALGKQAVKVKHLLALPYTEVGAFINDLKGENGLGARALEFTILTLARTNEVLKAEVSEFDLQRCIWTIPPERMKARKEHRVPLSKRAMEIANFLISNQTSNYLFPGTKDGRPLSNMAMLATLKRMGRGGEFTVHGFRSAFRDWAAEQTNYPRDVAEAALAHTIPDAVERAYRRGDLFEKRYKLMEEWAQYCSVIAMPGEIVSIRHGT